MTNSHQHLRPLRDARARCDDAKLVAETPAAVIRMWRSDYDNATAYSHSEHRHGLYGNFDIVFGPSIPLFSAMPPAHSSPAV